MYKSFFKIPLKIGYSHADQSTLIFQIPSAHLDFRMLVIEESLPIKVFGTFPQVNTLKKKPKVARPKAQSI